MIEITPPTLGLSGTVELILRALPQWFGIESATQMYIREADENPTLLAIDRDSEERTTTWTRGHGELSK